jgi:hypothetical protein
MWRSGWGRGLLPWLEWGLLLLGFREGIYGLKSAMKKAGREKKSMKR